MAGQMKLVLSMGLVVMLAVFMVKKPSIGTTAANVVSEHDLGTNEGTDENSKSWTAWSKDKIQQGLGLKPNYNVEDTVKVDKDKIEDVVSDGKQFSTRGAKEKAYEEASEAYNKANEKAQASIEEASEAAKDASNKASSMKDAASERAKELNDKAKQTAREASQKSAEVKDNAQRKAETAAHKADEVKNTVGHKVEEAKDTVSRKAREAKETVDQWVETGEEQGEHSSWMKEKAKEGYDAAKKAASRTLYNAKEMAKDMAAPKYDDDEL